MSRLPGRGLRDRAEDSSKPGVLHGGVATCAGGTCHLHPPQVLDLRMLLRKTTETSKR